MDTEPVRSRGWRTLVLSTLQRTESYVLVCQLGRLPAEDGATVYGDGSDGSGTLGRFLSHQHSDRRCVRQQCERSGALPGNNPHTKTIFRHIIPPKPHNPNAKTLL